MRNGKLVITALVLSVMVLALIILESFDIRQAGRKVFRLPTAESRILTARAQRLK